MCVCEREDLEEGGKKSQIVFLWCLSHAVSPYQPGSLTKARDPCQVVLDNCDLSAAGKPREI